MRHPAETYAKMHEHVCRALSGLHDNPATCAIYADMVIGFIMGDLRADLLANQREIDVDNMGQMINHVTSIKQLALPDDDSLPF